MIVLNINGFEMVLRASVTGHKYATATKRAILMSAFEQMPDKVVEKIWESAIRGDTQLKLLPKEKE